MPAVTSRERWEPDSIPPAARGRRLLLLGRDHHDHLPAFQARARFDHDVFAEVGLDPRGHLAAELLVAHLAAAEADVDLDLVALLQEAAHVAQLDLVVAFVGDRAELEFLDLDLLRLLLRLVGLFLLFEAELAEVHDLADRRIGVGLDLDEVEPRVLGHLQRFVAREHADHFAVRADHAHARDADILVAAVLLVVDADTWISKETRAGHHRGRACRCTATGHAPDTTLRGDAAVPGQARGKVCDGHRAQIFPRPRAHGDSPVLLFAVPHHEQVRHALQRMLANLIADFLVPQIP